MKIKNIHWLFLLFFPMKTHTMESTSKPEKQKSSIIEEKEKLVNEKPEQTVFFNMHALEHLENLFKNKPINMHKINNLMTKLQNYFKSENNNTIRLELHNALNSYETLKLDSTKKDIKDCHDNVIYRLQRLALLNNTFFNLLVDRNKTQLSKLL